MAPRGKPDAEDRDHGGTGIRAGAGRGTVAQAITGNVTEDLEHDYVGSPSSSTPRASHRCSGALLTDRVFLTAGHCVTLDDEGTVATSARVHFEQDLAADAPGHPTTGGVESRGIHDYGYRGPDEIPESKNAGVLVLDVPVQSVYGDITEYASLATAEYLDDYKAAHPGNSATTTVSGHGLQESNGSQTKQVAYRERLTAESSVIGLVDTSTAGYDVKLSTNPGGSRGEATPVVSGAGRPSFQPLVTDDR
jgi:hypothetical protein